jgi:hypothetical protein
LLTAAVFVRAIYHTASDEVESTTSATNSLGEEAPYDIWETRPLEVFSLGELEGASS